VTDPGRSLRRPPAALDPSDRAPAIVVWCGFVVGGFVVAVAILAINWSRRGSLARSQAMIATILYAVVAAVWFPMVIWAFGFGGNQTVLWVTWGLMVVIVLAVSVRGLILSFRAPIAAPPPPA
jgi:hypothetical protein